MHLRTQAPPKNRQALHTAILADAINLGLVRMAEACRETTWRQLSWTAERGEPLSKPVVEFWRAALLARGLSVSSVNQRLSAIRLLFRQAADRGALSAEEALRLASVPNVKQGGQRLGKWLTEGEAGKLLGVPDGRTRLGIRDRAILALLVACGLRRDELVRLEVRHLQLRDERWVLLNIEGKGRRVRRAGSALGQTHS